MQATRVKTKESSTIVPVDIVIIPDAVSFVVGPEWYPGQDPPKSTNHATVVKGVEIVETVVVFMQKVFILRRWCVDAPIAEEVAGS
jgi:hypothetical protein